MQNSTQQASAPPASSAIHSSSSSSSSSSSTSSTLQITLVSENTNHLYYQDFDSMVNSPIFHDVVFIVGEENQKFFAHRF